MKFKSKEEIISELVKNEDEKVSTFLTLRGNYSPSVFDEEWEEVEIVSGVKQINEELKEETTDGETNINNSISKSESN